MIMGEVVEENEEIDEETYEGDAEMLESGDEVDVDMDDISDPDDLMTDLFTDDETNDESTNDDAVGRSVVNGGDEASSATTDTSYHDAVETQVESSSDSELSGSDLEREVLAVRRPGGRQRIPKRVFTYDRLGGVPKISRYTLYSCCVP